MPPRTRRQVDDELLRSAPPVVDFDSSAITLRDSGIDEALCVELCGALRVNETVATLDLSGNMLGDTGAEALGALLPANSTVTCLDVSRNGIGDWGVVCIARGDRRNRALTSLNLAGNPIGDAGLGELGRLLLQSNSLRELVLTGTKVTFQGVIAFMEAALHNHSLLYLALPYSLGFKLLEEVDKLLRRNWARFQQLDRKLQVAELLMLRLEEQEASRRRQWASQQAAAEPPSARTRTVAAPMPEWRDREFGPSLLMLSLLDRRCRQEKEARAELEEERKVALGTVSPRNRQPHTSRVMREGTNTAERQSKKPVANSCGSSSAGSSRGSSCRVGLPPIASTGGAATAATARAHRGSLTSRHSATSISSFASSGW